MRSRMLPAFPLARAVAARQLGPSPTTLGVVAVSAMAAAAFGHHLAARGLGPQTGVESIIASATPIVDVVLWRLGRAVALPFVLAATYLVVDRVGDDEAQGWLAPLAAGGASRGEYLVAVVAGSAIVAVLAHALAAIAFAAGVATVATSGGGTTLRAAAGVPPAILSAAAYGAACVALARRRGRALALAVTGALLPLAVVAFSWPAGGGGEPPRMVVRLLTLHLPPWSWSAAGPVVLQHAAYSAIAIAFATWLARARLGRAP